MKTIISILAIVLALTLSVQAVAFDRNPFEVHEVNILEESLNPGISR